MYIEIKMKNFYYEAKLVYLKQEDIFLLITIKFFNHI